MIAKFFLIPLVTVFAVNASAQTTESVRLELRAGSELTFEGTSSLHSFHCKTTVSGGSQALSSTYANSVSPTPTEIVCDAV